ncbi:hypothetical protein [Myroides sp. WP-1]|uniref:hypothetical protein n=1 Tax=Myroides sp. WP-1 TaxID=2759944 RepID=UPI0015F85E4C|nr:hypothetical protein [Myroides sp. WP-1]MBB1139854.1 hypothetical protein [Myroides sp. WP-1]
MEWRKIEQEWKDRLDERTIVPSTKAWDKLANQLDRQEKKTQKRSYYKWMSIAACLVVGGILGLLFLKTEPILQPIPTDFSVEEHYVVTEKEQIKEESSNSKANQREEEAIPLKKTQRLVLKQEVLELAERGMEVKIPVQAEREMTDSVGLKEQWKNSEPSRVIVNSTNLLQQVEGEIEVEYRDTKMKKIIEFTKKAVVDISDSRYEK